MNIQNRVNDILEKDEIEKQRQLKEVEDFYRDIEEDLMVVCLYLIERFGYFSFCSQTNCGTTDAKSFTKIEGLYDRTSEFTNNEIFEENIEYIRSLTVIQDSRFIELFEESIGIFNLRLREGDTHCSHYLGIISSYYEVVKNDSHSIIEEEIIEKPIEPKKEIYFLLVVIISLILLLFAYIQYG